jgi:hypothetical protein
VGEFSKTHPFKEPVGFLSAPSFFRFNSSLPPLKLRGGEVGLRVGGSYKEDNYIWET